MFFKSGKKWKTNQKGILFLKGHKMNDIEHDAEQNAIAMRIEQAEERTVRAEARTEQAESRTEQAETRTEQAVSRAEAAETRTELAKTRTEQAEIRTEQAEARTEQAETILLRLVNNKDVEPCEEIPMQLVGTTSAEGIADRRQLLEQLTGRQREILQFIAEGRNTKEIAEVLRLSPKTIEYHRLKLMAVLNVHDIPGLVRFALGVGLVSPES